MSGLDGSLVFKEMLSSDVGISLTCNVTVSHLTFPSLIFFCLLFVCLYLSLGDKIKFIKLSLNDLFYTGNVIQKYRRLRVLLES